MSAPIQVHAYDGVTGAHLYRLPYTSAKWSDTLNDPGSLSIDIDYTQPAIHSRLRDKLTPWRLIIAAQSGTHIKHAGYLTSITWDASSRRLTLTCGGGLTIFSRRLVLDHRLATQWQDQEIITDETNPSGLMMLHIQGTYPDIIRGLVQEAMLWQPLPFNLPEYQGGTYYRNYFAWDMAYTLDRIQDITQLQNGPDVRADPYRKPDGSMYYQLTSQPNIIDHHWQWNTTTPNTRIRIDSEDIAGNELTTQVYATGGKGEDKTVMVRRYTNPPNGILLQSTNTSHTTDSNMQSLQNYALADLSRYAWPQQSIKMQVGDEYDVHVGDWADVRVDDDYLGRQQLKLKITSIDGDASSDWLSLQCSER